MVPASPSPEETTFAFADEQRNITATAGVPKTLFITTRDQYGNIQAVPLTAPLRMQAFGAEGKALQSLSFSFTYIGSGQYSGQFQFLLARKYSVQILISQTDIAKSPFECTVIPSSAVGIMSYNSSSVPSQVQAGQRVAFKVQVNLPSWTCA